MVYEDEAVAAFHAHLSRADCGCIGIWLDQEKGLMLVFDQCDGTAETFGESVTFFVRQVKSADCKPVSEGVAEGIYKLMQKHIWQATMYRQIRDALRLGIVE